MEWFVLGTLAVAGLAGVALFCVLLCGLCWLVCLPFRILGWALCGVFFLLKLALLLPLLVLFAVLVVLAAPVLLLLFWVTSLI